MHIFLRVNLTEFNKCDFQVDMHKTVLHIHPFMFPSLNSQSDYTPPSYPSNLKLYNSNSIQNVYAAKKVSIYSVRDSVLLLLGILSDCVIPRIVLFPNTRQYFRKP